MTPQDLVSGVPPSEPIEGGQPLGQLISVCLLTYNHAHLIRSTIESIRNQTLSGYEIIISDDCSTDGTWEAILEAARADPRIKPVRPRCNLGMAANANFAASHSSRPYLTLLHHDDVYRPDLLEKWVTLLERYPDAAFAYNPYGVYGSDTIHEAPMPAECVEGEWLLNQYLLPRWGCPIRGTAMIRRSAWDAVSGMRVQFGLLADIDLWMRLCMRWSVAYVDEPIIAVRHERPDDYPADYQEKEWSWRRYRLLCEIHAENRLAYLPMDTVGGRLKWWGFRLRLSVETAKWLVYAVVRHKPNMVVSSGESSTPFDLWPVRLLRWSLIKGFTLRSAGMERAS